MAEINFQEREVMSAVHRRKILILTQTAPADSGRGTRMRIGMAVEALARLGEISMLIVTQRASAVSEGVPEKYHALCEGRVAVIKDDPDHVFGIRDELMSMTPKLLATWSDNWLQVPALQSMAGDYDLVWVFRLRMWPVLQKLQKRNVVGARAHILDIDDVESKASFRRAMLQRLGLGKRGFVMELVESAKLRLSEARAAKYFDALLVCSHVDRVEMSARTDVKTIDVLPNGIRAPERILRAAKGADAATPIMLFVGSLDFYPNVEGLIWACEQVLPILKKLHPASFRFVVVGRNPDPAIIKLQKAGVLELHADVPDVAPYYAEASVIIVPIHAGSGTRIKILEAFAYQVPVVSTTLGAEGLEAQNNRHLAIADSAEVFAQRIASLLDDPEQGSALTRNASHLLEERFSLNAICSRIESIVMQAIPEKESHTPQ